MKKEVEEGSQMLVSKEAEAVHQLKMSLRLMQTPSVFFLPFHLNGPSSFVSSEHEVRQSA